MTLKGQKAFPNVLQKTAQQSLPTGSFSHAAAHRVCAGQTCAQLQELCCTSSSQSFCTDGDGKGESGKEEKDFTVLWEIIKYLENTRVHLDAFQTTLTMAA